METNYWPTTATEKGLWILRQIVTEFRADFFVVGGAVRDLLLGKRTFRDIDVVMSGPWVGLPEEFARRCSGSFFWLDEERRQARVVIPDGGGARTFDFAPLIGGSLHEDLCSRDFTINAIALVPGSGGFRLSDPLEGVPDLRNGIIRVPSPEVLDADPLRLLRAFRFAGTLGFRIDEATLKAITDRAHLAGDPAPERIRSEFFRLLRAPAAAPALAEMAKAGIIDIILPAAAEAPTAGSPTVAAIEETMASLPSRLAGEETSIQDDLDLETEADVSHGGLLKFASIIPDKSLRDEAAARLRLGRRSRNFLQRLDAATACLTCGVSHGDRSAFRFFRDHEPAALAALVWLLAESPSEASRCRDLLAYRRKSYDPTAPELLLDGATIMEILGIPAGPAVGAALEMLRRAEASGTVTDAAEAREYIAKNVLTTLCPVG